MGLTRLSIARPLTMLMIILGLVVMGVRAYTELQVDRFPQVDFPFVTIVVTFPGASPEDVEELVIKPIEDAVAGIPGIDQVTSQANESFGFVGIAFLEGVDGNQAAIDVERQVATVRGQLPEEASDPSVVKADINALPIMQLVLTGPQGQDVLFQIAEDQLKQRLQTIQGVASVNVSGGRDREIQVLADPAKLAAYNLPLEGIQGALASNNLTFPVGDIQEGRQKSTVRSVGDLTSIEAIEDVVVAGGPSPFAASRPTQSGQDSGGLVYLRDVATVQEGFVDKSQVLRYNGVDTVNISIIKAATANAIAVADDLRSEIEKIQEDLPVGAKIIVAVDDSEFTRESVAAVQEDLILAILVTGLVMLLFLHTIRSTFIVLLAVPTSIISTFLVMWALGFTLNTLTLLALVLVIGILVDDSIVVLENIERHLKMKKKPRQAALDGRSEIGLAAITITLVDVVVYLPVAFTSGLIGQFFRSYGITIAVATLFSLFISFTLTPMLAALWMKGESEPEAEPTGLRKVFSWLFRPIGWAWKRFTRLWEDGFDALANFYAATLRFALRNFWTQSLVVLIATLALGAGVYLVVSGTVGAEFFPQEDDGQFTIDIAMPPGTVLAATDHAARRVEQLILAEVPEVTTIITNVGSSGGGGFFGGGGSGSNEANITVRLVDKNDRQRSTTEVINALRPLANKIPEATITLAQASFGGPGGEAVQVQVFGPDPDTLIDVANQVEVAVKSVPGTVDVLNNDAVRAPETKLVIDHDRALAFGLSPAQIAGTLRTALSGTDVGKYRPGAEAEIDINLRIDEATRNDLNALLQMPLGYFNGQPVTVGQVATIERSQAPARVTRTDRQRVLTVSSNVEGRAAGDVTDDVEAAIEAQVNFPAGYGFRFTGISEQQAESFAQLFSAIVLSIGLIYMLLVALYQSWLDPLAIMFSLPVALVGAFGGLWLFGFTLSIISILGIILLVGVVTKNAILVVDFTKQLREEQGYELKEALVQAGRLRLRPIIMTTAALVFALLPVLLGKGAGAEVRAPLAAVVIGGNTSSTLLTLILVPVVYNFFNWISSRFSSIMQKLFGTKRVTDEGDGDDGSPKGDAGGLKPGVPPQPAPQPGAGSAVSLAPPTSDPRPDPV